VDLSPGQQKAVFVLVVVVLAALGYWLILPKVSHSGGHAQAATTPTSRSPSSAAASAQASDIPTSTATVSPTAAGNVNIYSWLPFTQQDLADAAAVTVKFGVDYNTYSYTESAAAYVAKMSGLITGELATTLQASYSTPGVATLRTSQKQVSTGTAVVSSLRAFGPSSLTFVITTGQRLVSSRGTTNGSTQYAVTVTGSGSSWQVDDIELASAGNS
jgi:septal ring-binding cell division protein DamX